MPVDFRILVYCLLVGFSIFGFPPLSIAAQDGGQEFVREIEGVKEYQLANGLKILLYPDSSKSTFMVNVVYLVGSRHEGYGEYGMAHLLEHMVFKGTQKHNNIWQMLQEKGAQFNGSTNSDRTNYFEILPSTIENLDFILELEADRMVNSRISAEDLAQEFSVVRNEFEMRENDPGQTLSELMDHAAYSWHGYGRSTIGNRSDIERVSAERLRLFYKHYYQPDNAVLIITGSFPEKDALSMVQKYFGAIPKPIRKLENTYTVEPVQEGEKKVQLERPGDQAIVSILYHTVSVADSRSTAISAIGDALVRKPNGLLYKELVEKGIFTEIENHESSNAEPGYLSFSGRVAKGKDPKKAAQIFCDLLSHIKPEAFTERQVELYKADRSLGFDRYFADSNYVGQLLGETSAFGDWRLTFILRDRLGTLTVQDLRSNLSWFKDSNRTVGVFIPTDKPTRAPDPGKLNIAKEISNYQVRPPAEQGEAFDSSFENLKQRTKFYTLSSGLKVAFLAKKSKGKLVKITLNLPLSGTASDLRDQQMVINLLPDLMIMGTEKLNYQALIEELSLNRAFFWSAGVWDEKQPGVLLFSADTNADHLSKILDIFGDILRHPRFDPHEFDELKKHRRADFLEILKDPASLASEAFRMATLPYPAHDIRAILSFPEKIKALDRVSLSDVRRLYQKSLGSSQGTLTVVGDFNPDEVRAHLEKIFQNWTSKLPYKPLVYQYVANPVIEKMIDTPDKKSATVVMGYSTPIKELGPDVAEAEITGLMWGHSSDSRLMQRLRQKDGLSYYVDGMFDTDAKMDFGYFINRAFCAPNNVKKVVNAIREELEKFQRDGVSLKELEFAKKSYTSMRQNYFADDSIVQRVLMNNLVNNRDWNFQMDLDQKIAALSLDQVNAFIKKAYTPERMITVMAFDKTAAAADTLK